MNKKTLSILFFSFLFLLLFPFVQSVPDFPDVNLTAINYCLNPNSSYSFDLSDQYDFDPGCNSGVSSWYNLTYKVIYSHGNGSSMLGALTMANCYAYWLLPASWYYPNSSSFGTYFEVHPHPTDFWGELSIDLYRDDDYPDSDFDTKLKSFTDITINSSCDLPAGGGGGGGNGTNTTLWDDLVLWYDLDEGHTSGSQTVIDYQGNRNGTLADSYSNISGVIGSAYNFTRGDAGKITTSYLEAIDVINGTATNFTISFWYNIYDIPNVDGFWHNNNFLFDDQSGDGDFDSNIYGSGTQETGVPVVYDTWTHVVIRYNGSKVQFIQNNTYYTASSGSPQDSASDYRFDTAGGIDLIGFWNRALSDSEITELYNSSSGTSPATSGGGASSPTLAYSFPDVYMNSSSGNWTNLSYYYSNASAYIVRIDDWVFNISANSTHNMSYEVPTKYKVWIYGNNTMKIESYSSNWTAPITIFGCYSVDMSNIADIQGTSCTNDTFNLYIQNSTGSGVLELQSFPNRQLTGVTPAYTNLDYHYSYHDKVNFTFLDTNSTGYVGMFGQNYELDVISQGLINVTLTCWKSNSSLANYSGSLLNLTMYCSNSSQATITYIPTNWSAFTLFTQPAYIQASNSINTSNLATFNITWNRTGAPNSSVTNASFESPLNFSTLHGAIPKSSTHMINWYYVVIVLVIAFVLLFTTFISITGSLLGTILISLGGTWLVALFFSVGGYLPWPYTIVPPVLFLTYLALRMGGGK